MLNLHQLADELNRDRLARAEYQRPARQLQSQRRHQAASQALQAIRHAIDQIDAIIETARDRQPQTARPAEYAETHPAYSEISPDSAAPEASLR